MITGRIRNVNNIASSLNLCMWVICFMFLLSSADFFSKLTFSTNSLRNTIRVSNVLRPRMSVLVWIQTVFAKVISR